MPLLVLRDETVTAPVPAVARELRSTAPVVVSALIDLPVSSRAEVLPMPEAALRSMVPEPTLISAPASALASSLIDPTLVIVTRSLAAVIEPTSTLPLVVVVSVTFWPVPPATRVVAVRSLLVTLAVMSPSVVATLVSVNAPPVTMNEASPTLVVALVIVVAASFVTIKLPVPLIVAVVTVRVCEPV